jgi:hypothetical protein
MATIEAQLIPHGYSHIAEIWKWTGVTEDDECLPAQVPHKADKTVQVVGDFGTGGAIDIEGAALPQGLETDFALLDDTNGNAMTILTKKPLVVAPNVSRLRPRPSAGTDVLVDIVLVITG